MRNIVIAGVLLGLAACAGQDARDDDRAAERAAARREAERELERECRIAAMQRRHDPRCPQAEDGSAPPQTTPLELPQTPPLPVPR